MSGHIGADNKVFVRFSAPLLYNTHGFGVEKDIRDWLVEHNLGVPEYGFTGQYRVGIYLDPTDSVAFKLRFG